MPPDDPVFFVDADLSDKWFFRVLEEAGIAFERVEVTYKSAWFLCHRIRKAMEKKRRCRAS